MQVHPCPGETDCFELITGDESMRVHVGTRPERDEVCRAFSMVLGCEPQNYGLLADLIDLSTEAILGQSHGSGLSAS
jgi:hypothetical protein